MDASDSVQLFGSIPKSNGEAEPDLWGRVLKRDWVKYCSGEHARLDVSSLSKFHFPRIPKPAVIFVIQWIAAGGKDSMARDAVKYPREDLRNIVLLHEIAKDLGIKSLIDRTGAEIGMGNSRIRSPPFLPATAAARGAATAANPGAGTPAGVGGAAAARGQHNLPKSIFGPTIAPRGRNPQARPPPVFRRHFPLEIVAEDEDGTWIIHTDGHLGPWRGGIADDVFAGTLRVTGIVAPTPAAATAKSGPPTTTQPPAPPTKDALEFVARWKSGFWKVVAEPGTMAREIPRKEVKERGHLGALGWVVKNSA